jgi:hypothetical protein
LSFIDKKDWEFIDFISFDKKINDIKNFAFSRIQELTEALSKEKSNTYLDKVFLKIFDNLQLNFSNIHIRFEDFCLSPAYSLGFTLQNISIVNTDGMFNQIFIDRSSNKDLDVFKLLKISNFGLFLKINDHLNISSLENNSAIENKLNELFPMDSSHIKDMEYLIKPSKIK